MKQHLEHFDPLVAEWFAARFEAATEPQARGWPEIRSGRDVLISAPTGSGKTLASFLICLDSLVRQARHGRLADRTQLVYVSPLKALSNDVRKNLEVPLAGIRELAIQQGVELQPIRTAVRTGDTTAWERQKMLAEPPHVLVTTPESLFILLTAEKSRRMLSTATAVIVDEIYAVADDKRGSHLALSLARLEALVLRSGFPRPQRIGLSATVKPIEEVARFLGDCGLQISDCGLQSPVPNEQPTVGRPAERRRAATGAPALPAIINVGHQREMELGVEVPRDELGAVATNEQWSEIYDRLAELIRAHRTTLVFVNTRRVAERVAHQLGERMGQEQVLPHHGSLSRRLRLNAEERLKRGELRAVVATASLELGIDIGSMDLVCQVGSPRSIAIAFQRVGRSGHWLGARPKGRLFATTRDELIECAALVRAMRQGELDGIEIPQAPLDVLAQQIVAETSVEPWREEDLFELFRGCYSYRHLARTDFDSVVEMLAEGVATRRGRHGAYLHRDRVNGIIRGRRGARLAAMTSGGTIPETGACTVVVEPEGIAIGTVDEDFAAESTKGDIFLLGTTSWRIRRIESGRVRVENARGAAPSVPFWRGEAPPRTAELSAAFSRLRQEIASRSASRTSDAVEFLMCECGLDRRGAEQAVAYVSAGRKALGAVPTLDTIVAERFFDEAGGMQLVLHAPLGARINRAWGLALRKRFCRTFNFELQAAASDNGIVISLSDQHSFPLDLVFHFLREESIEPVLTQAMLPTPFFSARWRWNATRALAVLRFTGGRKVPAPIQRMRSDDLLAAVFPDQAACAENLAGEIRIPDHPLVNETIANCLREAMDLEGLRCLLRRIETGAICTVAVDTAEATPFSHEIINSNPYTFLDDAPLEERRVRAVQMRRTLDVDEAGDAAALDIQAITEVAAQSWPVVRDADELHDALLTLVVLPCGQPALEAAPWRNGLVPGAPAAWTPFFEQLVGTRRVTTLRAGEHSSWVAAEQMDLARRLYPEGVFVGLASPVRGSRPVPEDPVECAAAVLRGWMDSSGPVSASELAGALTVPVGLIRSGLARLEAEGQVLRGSFIPAGAPGDHRGDAEAAGETQRETEWCNRRVLARIHRMTLGRLRREIEPVSAADLMRFLLGWHHLAPGSQLHGTDGLLQIVRQLQGYELPAGAWEAEVLARRVAGYKPESLDQLCLAGEVMWGRLSPHPAFKPMEDETGSTESKAFRQAGSGHASAAASGNAGALGGQGYLPPHRRIRPSRIAPIALFLREDAPWLAMLARSSLGSAGILPASAAGGLEARALGKDDPSLSHPARDILLQLQSRGALFFAELVRATRRLPSEIEDGLWELVAAGLVTADGFENLRALADPRRRRGERGFRTARPRHAGGRWALLEGAQVAANFSSPRSAHDSQGGELKFAATYAATCAAAEQSVANFAKQLLRRWGVVFRDLLARETLAATWRDLLVALRRMEARGEVRGGRFVDGFMGEQFALPEAVELLRGIRRTGKSGAKVTISAADPLNLAGIITPGERISPAARQAIVLHDGVDEVSSAGVRRQVGGIR